MCSSDLDVEYFGEAGGGAGLNPALMYGAGGGGGSTTAGSGAGGQATASGAGKQQLLHDRTTPIDIANITVAAAQAKKLEAEANNLEQDSEVKKKQLLKLAEEISEVKANVARIEGETALQGWAQRQLMKQSKDQQLAMWNETKCIVTGKQIGRAHV